MEGTPKWMFYNGKSYWNGWFGGSPMTMETSIWVGYLRHQSTRVAIHCFFMETCLFDWRRQSAAAVDHWIPMPPAKQTGEKHAQFPYVRSMEKHTLGICHDTVKMMAVFPGKFKWDMGVWRNTHQVQWWFNGIVMGYNYDQQCEMGVAKRNYHSHQYRVTSEPRCVTPNDAQAIPANLW